MSQKKGRDLEDRWQPVFRHSAGKLGSQYLVALRGEKRLLAWKTTLPNMLTSPPKDFGCRGEWVEIGPGAKLLSYVPRQWFSDGAGDIPEGYVLCRVLVDGAKAPTFALLKIGASDDFGTGARLDVRFNGPSGAPPSPPDFWFELTPSAALPAGSVQ